MNKTAQIVSVFFLLLVMLTMCPFVAAQATDGNDRLSNFGSSLLPTTETKKKKKKKNEKEVESKSAAVLAPVVEASEGEVIHVDTTLVVSDVLVLDKNGKVVEGLTQNDFRILEDDNRQEISIFAKGQESALFPRSIVLVIDHSGSQFPYLKDSIEAAKTLVDSLPTNDRLAIVTDDVEVLSDFTTDRSLLKEKLDSLLERTFQGKIGKSMQCSALMATMKELFKGDEMRPIVIFQTDGDQSQSLAKPKVRAKLGPNFSYEELVKTAVETGTTIYAVVPGRTYEGMTREEKRRRIREEQEIGARTFAQIRNTTFKPGKNVLPAAILDNLAMSRERDEKAVAQLARETGGWASNLDSPASAADVYARILADINSRYMIGYYPTNETRDGRVRTITVTINDNPGYTIWGRRKYTAPNNLR